MSKENDKVKELEAQVKQLQQELEDKNDLLEGYLQKSVQLEQQAFLMNKRLQRQSNQQQPAGCLQRGRGEHGEDE